MMFVPITTEPVVKSTCTVDRNLVKISKIGRVYYFSETFQEMHPCVANVEGNPETFL